MNNKFLDWLNDEMRGRGWGLMDLHRASGLDAGGLSNLMAGKRKPGIKTCKSLARAFRVPVGDVLQVAGLVDRNPQIKTDALIGEINDIYEKLTPYNQVESLEYFRMKLRVQEERGDYESSSRDVHPPHDESKS